MNDDTVETIQNSRTHLTQAVTRSYDGDSVECRRHIREAMSLMDAILEGETEVQL